MTATRTTMTTQAIGVMTTLRTHLGGSIALQLEQVGATGLVRALDARLGECQVPVLQRRVVLGRATAGRQHAHRDLGRRLRELSREPMPPGHLERHLGNLPWSLGWAQWPLDPADL